MLSLAGTLQVISSLMLRKCSLLSLEVPKELTSKTREVPKENLKTLAKSKSAAAPYRLNHAVLATLQNSTFMLLSLAAVFSIVTQRSSLRLWGGALRDDTKNGCEGDYFHVYFERSPKH